MLPTHPQQSSLAGKVALITGSSGGIGTATARLLARHGCSICLHYNSDDATTLALKSDLEKEYNEEHRPMFTCFKADLGDYEQVRLSPPFNKSRSLG